MNKNDLNLLWKENREFVIRLLGHIQNTKYGGKGDLRENDKIKLYAKESNPPNISLNVPSHNVLIYVYMDPTRYGRFMVAKVKEDCGTLLVYSGIQRDNLLDKIAKEVG